MSNRHPSSNQSEPTEKGEYWVKGFPGDDWRRLQWNGEGFYAKHFTFKQLWWKWREVETP